MRCFKLFFNHTWRLQHQMDNPAHLNTAESEESSRGETELKEVKIPAASSSRPAKGTPCDNGACRASSGDRTRGSPSPWSSLKTAFLISFLIALIIWILVYTILSQLGLL